jgi:hypothetical protein
VVGGGVVWNWLEDMMVVGEEAIGVESNVDVLEKRGGHPALWEWDYMLVVGMVLQIMSRGSSSTPDSYGDTSD